LWFDLLPSAEEMTGAAMTEVLAEKLGEKVLVDVEMLCEVLWSGFFSSRPAVNCE